LIQNKTINKFQFFPFHLVDPSPWPILLSFSLLNLTIGAVAYMHGFTYGGYILTIGFILTTYGMILWFRDVIIEGTYLGHHTKEVKNGIMIGVLLFIVSEIFAFLSVFWAFFHSSLSPTIEIGGSWPPLGITPLDPFAIPLLNTFLLLSSGVCHKCEIFDYFVLVSSSSFYFCSPKLNSFKRIGPHNWDILSIIIGSLLGNGSMEKSINGSRFVYYQAKENWEYLLWLHQVISKLGYTDKNIPKIYSRNKLVYELDEIRYYFRFRTFTFSSFDWIYDAFYPNKSRKVIPNIIGTYLTPLSLAVWMMDDGPSLSCVAPHSYCEAGVATLGVVVAPHSEGVGPLLRSVGVAKKKGFKFSNNSFTLKEVQNLAWLLKTKYKLDTNIHKSGLINQYNIYIPKASFINLREIVKPYFHPTMLYKINNI